MSRSVPFRFNRNGLLLALVSAAFACEASAAAGRVDFATDGATISGTDGKQRPLTKGTELGTGDTIRTDTGGRAQIRFPDGAYVSLQPNTEFSVKEYNFDGKADGTERGFFALAKGAMRTVTGLIGRVNKNRYQIATPTATIGIRGTGGLISIGADGSTLVNGTSGIWTITNPAGTIDVPAGTAGKAPSAPNQPPQQTTEKPSTGPTQPTTTQQPYTQASNVTPAGVPVDLVPTTPPIIPLASGSGYSAAIAYISGSGGVTSGSNLDAIFTSTGQLTSIQPSTPANFGFSLGNGTHAEFGTDGILAWGRWIGSITQNCDCTNPQVYAADQGLHYVVGIPTAVMPTGGTATYATAGATSPTFASGGATGTFTLNSLTVAFGTGTATVNLNFNVAIGGATYRVDAPGTASSAQISFSPSVSSPDSSGCVQGCGGTVQGFFAGTSAERIGVGYALNDFLLSKTIMGAAAFKKTGP